MGTSLALAGTDGTNCCRNDAGQAGVRETKPVMPNESLDKSWIRSRFGRRLVILFVVCSLLPTIALAVLSYRTVTRQLSRASLDRLEHTAGVLGKAIRDRLLLLDQDLAVAPMRSAPCPAGGPEADASPCDGSLEYGFSALAFVPASGPAVAIFGTTGPLPPLSVREREGIAAGKGVVASQVINGKAGIFLIRAVSSAAGRGLVVGQINEPYLWGDLDQTQLLPSMEFHVVDDSAAVIVTSDERGATLPESARRNLAAAMSGTFEWKAQGKAFQAAYGPMPASDSMAVPQWSLVVSESRANVVAPLVDFNRTFLLVAVTGLGIALLLSLIQIRRNTAPLQALRDGTLRVAKSRFDEPVVVTSEDEFAEVAASFNSMSGVIQRQFFALTAAAEIDRALLGAGTAGQIVATVLNRMGDVCAAGWIGFTMVDAEHEGTATTYVTDDASGAAVAAWAGTLARAEQDHLADITTELALSDAAAPDYLVPLTSRGARSLLVFPLVYQDRLLGAITFGDSKHVGRSSDVVVQARRAADQVAQALATAQMVERIRLLAFYDSLTGLPNRVSFRHRLGEELERHRRDGAMLAVFFLDLDHFSRINDSLGHKLGDRLIQEVGRRIRSCCGLRAPAAEVARLGGDEFTIILPRIAGTAAAADLAQAILASFGTPFALDGHEVFVSASVGVAINPDDGTDLETLVKNADAAMYQAKQRGRNRCELYATAMGTSAVRRLLLENHMRKAIDTDQFVMWYQPIVDLDTGIIVSAEALIRWQHPEWGMVGPGEFIPLAEESGLIVPLGEWIIQTVCAQNAEWQRQGLRAIPIAVNVSGQQLRGDAIVAAVQRTLASTGLDPRYLALELTESILMQGEGEASAVLYALAALGMKLAIDDFGIGYSSLSYLKQFPVSTLKIDQSFIRDVTTNPDDAAITSAIIAMSSALGITVVAEGVETEEQVRFLRQQRCARIQGYLVGRPAAAHAFGGYLQGDGVIMLPRAPGPKENEPTPLRLVKVSG
ncbi:MAG: EAL domain-containing protein [Gemmatimonadota bacterium]